MKRWARFAIALLFIANCASALAEDRDVPVDRVMSAFFKIDAAQAHLVLRVPLDLLRAISFPVIHGNYDTAQLQPAENQAFHALASDITLWADNTKLVPSGMTGRLTALSDHSFETYESALTHLAATADPGDTISFELGYLDVHFVYPITSSDAVFTIQSRIAPDMADMVKLIVHYQPLHGESRAITIVGGAGRVNLNPAWYQAAGGFIALGIDRILGSIDHSLFLLCLILPFRRIKELVPVIAAFAIGESVTLIGSEYNLAPAGAWFPLFIETAVAATIVYIALENIVGADLRRRWILTALFGLIHGFGFAGGLNERLPFAGSHIPLSILSFDIGIEIGQLVVLCICVPALFLLFRGAMAGRMGIIVVSALICHTAWHWMIDSGELLWQMPWPQFTLASFLLLARWAFAILLAAGAAQILARWIEHKWPQFLPPASSRSPVKDSSAFGRG